MGIAQSEQGSAAVCVCETLLWNCSVRREQHPENHLHNQKNTSYNDAEAVKSGQDIVLVVLSDVLTHFDVYTLCCEDRFVFTRESQRKMFSLRSRFTKLKRTENLNYFEQY